MKKVSSDSLLHGAGVGAGGALIAGGAVGPRLGALAAAAHALASAAAQQTQAGHAGVGAGGAVAVLSRPVRVALAETARAAAVTC